MDYFNHMDSDSIDRVSSQLDEVSALFQFDQCLLCLFVYTHHQLPAAKVKGIMVQNISKLLDRGEAIDTMADKTTQVLHASLLTTHYVPVMTVVIFTVS